MNTTIETVKVVAQSEQVSWRVVEIGNLPEQYEHVLICGGDFRKVCEGYLSRAPYEGFETEADGYVPLFCDATEWYGEEGSPDEKRAAYWMPLPNAPLIDATK